jgi:transketolase
MTSSHHRLTNVCVLVDWNKYQSQGSVREIKNIEPLDEKWAAFGWDVISIDGHDVVQICGALDRVNGRGGKPVAIIASTVKGKGVSFMENTFKYHNASITEQEYKDAQQEILDQIRIRSATRA